MPGTGRIQRQGVTYQRNIVKIIHMVLYTEQNSLLRINRNGQTEGTVVIVCFKKVLLNKGLYQWIVVVVRAANLKKFAGYRIFSITVFCYIFVAQHGAKQVVCCRAVKI